MPYRVPDTFFDDVENTIMINVRKRQNQSYGLSCRGFQ